MLPASKLAQVRLPLATPSTSRTARAFGCRNFRMYLSAEPHAKGAVGAIVAALSVLLIPGRGREWAAEARAEAALSA
jgi:hypothetical protein